jgi:hypothetical protein
LVLAPTTIPSTWSANVGGSVGPTDVRCDGPDRIRKGPELGKRSGEMWRSIENGAAAARAIR